MKLITKLTLFVTLSKLAVVVLFVLLLPLLVGKVAFQYTNYYLQEQKKKVLDVIRKNGIDFYLQGDSSYGSYTLLKEEYISLAPANGPSIRDTIQTSLRVVEGDTLSYRVLSHQFTNANRKYLLEIGKTTATISEYNLLLQRFTLFALIGLIAITILIDLVFTRKVLRPLGVIIRTKLVHRTFPFKEPLTGIKTSTADFKYLDDSLIDLMNKINEAFQKEREFTSNASHELMTPISILKSKIENILLSHALDEDAQVKIAGLLKTLARLKRIVQTLLYISRIENDQFLKTDQVDLYRLLEDVKDELSHRIEIRKILFKLNIRKDVLLHGVNRDLIFQLFYNLVNNAIRYNREEGEILISDKLVHGKSYSLSITDTGIGIGEKDLGMIFDRFRKKSGQSGEEGYGLGLSIVKSIVRYHGMNIVVSSEVGSGSEFRLIFPREIVA